MKHLLKLPFRESLKLCTIEASPFVQCDTRKGKKCRCELPPWPPQPYIKNWPPPLPPNCDDEPDCDDCCPRGIGSCCPPERPAPPCCDCSLPDCACKDASPRPPPSPPSAPPSISALLKKLPGLPKPPVALAAPASPSAPPCPTPTPASPTWLPYLIGFLAGGTSILLYNSGSYKRIQKKK